MTAHSQVLLAVNGTLMRGLELNANMVRAGATFVRETRTAACYRLWSIDDRHPAMLKSSSGGAAIDVEVWELSPAAVAEILLAEPAGLSVGKVLLEDDSEVLGVIGEPFLVEDQKEITEYGGWRPYRAVRFPQPASLA